MKPRPMWAMSASLLGLLALGACGGDGTAEDGPPVPSPGSPATEALRSPTVCTGCDPGVWTLASKHLETLEN